MTGTLILAKIFAQRDEAIESYVSEIDIHVNNTVKSSDEESGLMDPILAVFMIMASSSIISMYNFTAAE